MLPLDEVVYIKDSFRISRLMSATPGYRLVALKGLPCANPGLIVNESSGFADGIRCRFWRNPMQALMEFDVSWDGRSEERRVGKECRL